MKNEEPPVLMRFEEAAGACNGELFAGNDSGFSGVCIDSREVKKGFLFVAFNGEHIDGHRFVEKAFEAGAAGALVEKKKLNEFFLLEIAAQYEAALIAVDDTLHGLQEVAAAYIKKFPKLLRIGITGSSGKTPTKEIAAAMIGSEKKVVCNQGNLNSETGLPLSVFSVRDDHEVGIFEMGMNRKGEIAELAFVLQPNVALITNIGPAHIGIIGSLENIAKEKKAVFSQFSGSETAFIPEYDKSAEFLREGVNGRVLQFGPAVFNKMGGKRKDDFLFGAEIIWEGISAHFSLPGEHNFKNMTAAIALAKAAGISGEAVRRGIASVKPLFGRSEVFEGDVTVVRDCYNANPESMRQAIDLCDALDWKGRRVYVIGSMLELGAVSAAEHENTARQLMSSNADYIFLYGEETKTAHTILKDEHTKKVFWTCDMDVLKTKLKELLTKGDLLLLKGSRGCALERAWEL